MDKKTAELIEYMDLEQLQRLLGHFAAMTGLDAVFVDPDGEPLTGSTDAGAPPQWLRGDQYLHTGRKLAMESRKAGERVEIPLAGGVYMGAAPVFCYGSHLGSLLAGPVRFDDTANAKIHAPLMSRKEFDKCLAFIESLGRTVAGFSEASHSMENSNKNLEELTEELNSTVQMMTRFANSADVGLFVTDFFTGEILQANEYFARFTGMSVPDLLGKPCWRLENPNREAFCDYCPHHLLLNERGHPGEPVISEQHYPEKNMWMRLTNQAIYWVDGRLAHMVTLIDITQNKSMRQQLEQLAYYDKAMLLPNMLKLTQDLREMDAAQHDSVCLICCNLVSFRTINNVYGRENGDALLKEIAEWLSRLAGDNATLYRIEGDKFCLLVRCTESELGKYLAYQIEARFSEAWVPRSSGESFRVFCNVTLGLICLNERRDSTGELHNILERMMLRAREQGNIAVYDAKMDMEHKQHLNLQMSLRNCIKEGMQGFEVHYQPIVSAQTGIWCAVEALCRWNSPQLGQVSPAVFIREAEQLGLIGTLDWWVLETSVRQCKQWQLDKLPNFVLDVNLSLAQVVDGAFATAAIELLARSDYPPEKLCLEITESVEMDFGGNTMGTIKRLRRTGIRVALDDFGTGYSSLNNLKNLPVCTLKTERAFLENIETDRYLQYLFHMLVELAHVADMSIIAEGVETREQLNVLVNYGVDYLQGYLFSRPLPAEVMGGKLKNFAHPPDGL